MAEEFAERRVTEGRLEIEPERTALLIIDMVNDFLEDGGAMVLASGRALYEPLNRLLDAARESGMEVIWVCDRHRRDDREFDKRVVHCIEGTWGAEIVSAFEPREDEYEIVKRRYNAFFQTDLDLRLRERGITQVIATGVVTNICVRSTVHDAFFLGYDVIVPRDGVGATGEREQESSLYDIETHFGRVCEIDDILTTIGVGATSGRS